MRVVIGRVRHALVTAVGVVAMLVLDVLVERKAQRLARGRLIAAGRRTR